MVEQHGTVKQFMTGTLGFSLIHRVGAAMSDFVELLGQKIGSTIELKELLTGCTGIHRLKLDNVIIDAVGVAPLEMLLVEDFLRVTHQIIADVEKIGLRGM